jgi:hypothetical protein
MNAKPDDFIKNLPLWAEKYMDDCLSKTKEIATGSGKIVKVRERNIPTIDYFLHIWLPLISGETIARDTYYRWLHSEDDVKSYTIKSIDNKFKALAADIVANEGKGIFYAKNKLGWTDKQIQDINLTNINANFGNSLQSPSESKEGT